MLLTREDDPSITRDYHHPKQAKGKEAKKRDKDQIKVNQPRSRAQSLTNTLADLLLSRTLLNLRFTNTLHSKLMMNSSVWLKILPSCWVKVSHCCWLQVLIRAAFRTPNI